jgi:DHA2 family methylenomycin A resistance protein-like MFS transporter
MQRCAELTSSRRPAALAAVLLGFFIVMLDTTIVNVALSAMGSDLHAPVPVLQWVVDAYTLVFAALLLTAGTACDRLGARRVYIAGLALFGALSAVCAFAPNGAVLIGARAVQGIGAAAVVPGSLALLSGIYDDPRERSRAIGLWGGAGAVAAAVGPVLGGALISWIGWRAVFWVNFPIVVATLWLTWKGLPAATASQSRREHGIDLPGQLLCVLGLAVLTYGIISGGDTRWALGAIIAAVCGLLILAGFALAERRSRRPMLPMGIFRDPRFTVASLVGLALNISFFGQLFVLSLFFQHYLGLAPWLAGLALAPQACSGVIASPLGGRAAARIGAFPTTLIGLLVGAAGFASLVRVTASTPYPVVAALTFIGGFGMAFAMPAVTSAAVMASPPQYTGLAGGVINAARQTGSVIGVAVLGTMVATGPFLDGFHLAVASASGVFIAAAILVTSVLGRTSDTAQAH